MLFQPTGSDILSPHQTMSKPSRAQWGTLTTQNAAPPFHIDFSPDGDTFLETNDGHSFRVKFADLALISSYFAQFEPDPSPTTLPRLSLVHATWGGLWLVLVTYQHPAPSPSLIPEAVGECFRDALQVANHYAFADFYQKFRSHFTDAGPYMQYAIAVMAGDQLRLKAISHETLRVPIETIPPAVHDLLLQHGGIHWTKLLNLHQTWSAAYDRLLHNLSGDLQVNIRLDGFGERCKRRFSRGCDGLRLAQGRFPVLRKIAAKAVYEVCVANGLRAMCPAVEDAIHEAVGCETCAHRLINAYDAGIRRVFHGVPDTV
ncbi:hypothetical protein IAT38_001550 [Cryptococcus sp. DSM 104549]